MNIDFADKVALITGGLKGIGLETAKSLLNLGCKVAIIDVDTSNNSDFLVIQDNVSNISNISKHFDYILSQIGCPNILINNVGITQNINFLNLTESNYDEVMDINLKSMTFYCQEFIKRNKDKGGTIVNVSSIASTLIPPNQTIYCLSKGGVNQLTRSLAVDFAQYGFRINSVAPGSVDTDTFNNSFSDIEMVKNRVLSRTPLGVLATPKQISDTIIFLASEMSSYITGQVIYVDGGRSVLNGFTNKFSVSPLF
jgi:NAD(P)-dependent dehydrogenase (short-subunit alcohol dehydrogenase family)